MSITIGPGGQILALGGSGGSGGGRTEFYSATNTGLVNINPGQPVARDGAGTGIILADATALATACVGLSEDLIAPGASGQVRTDGSMRLTDWTAVIGAAALTPGSTYYLSKAAAGTLTTVAVVAPGIHQVVLFAATTQQAQIEVDPAIVL